MNSPSKNVVVETIRLHKNYRASATTIDVLNGVDLSLERGAFEAVMGPSGAGKSTLLHIIAGLLPPDQGEVRIDGVTISGLKDEEVTKFRRRKIGLIFQDFNLISTLTAEENITLPLLLDRRRPDRERLENLMAELKLKERRTHLPAQLSGGERQRVAIARALVTDPAIVLADEPTGNLDSPAGRAFCELLQQMNRNVGATILLVSHDPIVAASANKVHLMRDGRVVESFATENNSQLLSERYLRSMQG